MLAIFIAGYANMHLGKDDNVRTAAEFLTPFGDQLEDAGEESMGDDPDTADLPDDVSEEVRRAVSIQAAMAAHGARERNMPLMPGHGQTVPSDVFALFARNDEAKGG